MTEPATPEPETPAAVQADESLAEHEAAFGPTRTPRGAPPSPPASPDDADRDAQGRAKIRHRADSQKAKADDVPRIQELTKKLREAEAERDRLKTPPAAPAVVPPVAAAPSPPVAPATTKPPAVTDFKDLESYLDARDRWNREVWRQEETQRAEAKRITDSWKARTAEAMKHHPDFEAVALKAPTTIAVGTLADAWILESEHGAEVLYALQSDNAMRERILALPPVQQAQALSRLELELIDAMPKPKAASPPAVPAPKPPTLVRTGPVRATEEPPGDDASLAEHEKVWGLKRRR